jgi:hypothetical protein
VCSKSASFLSHFFWLSHTHRKQVLSLCLSLLFVFSCGSHCISACPLFASYGRGVSFAHLFPPLACVVSFRRIASRLLPYSSFVLPLPLFITPTLIVTHHKHVGLVLSHICTTKSIIVYIIFRFAFSFFLFVLVPFGFLRLFCDGPINTKELHSPFS